MKLDGAEDLHNGNLLVEPSLLVVSQFTPDNIKAGDAFSGPSDLGYRQVCMRQVALLLLEARPRRLR